MFGKCVFKTVLIMFFLAAVNFSAQVNPSRSKGEVFKNRPDKPYENTNYSGLIIVLKGNYGLTFEDRQLSADVKNRIEKFFKRRLNGYTELKKYHLRVYEKRGKWYIDNTEI
jgi:hypothetical protein